MNDDETIIGSMFYCSHDVNLALRCEKCEAKVTPSNEERLEVLESRLARLEALVDMYIGSKE